MTVFKLQQYLAATDDWSVVLSFKPDYRLAMTRVGAWYNPFKRRAGVALDFVAAEKKAYQQALILAKRTRRRFFPGIRLRIMRESTWSGRELKDILWQDGKRLKRLMVAIDRKPEIKPQPPAQQAPKKAERR